MRRYRKGQTFRPPSTAESAAIADAVEAHRSQPAQPQDRPPRDHELVKIPAGGIPARDDTTIYSATCTRCVETSGADERTILESDEEIIVFNFHPFTLLEDTYATVGRTLAGTHYAIAAGLAARWGKPDASIAPGASGTVSLWQGKTVSDEDFSGYHHDSGDDVTATMGACISRTVTSDMFVLLVNMYGTWMIWDYYC